MRTCGNGSCHELEPSSPKEIARMAHADVKNIADDQAISMVDQNYANIAQSIKIYVCEIVTDALRLPAVSGDHQLHVSDVKNISGNDQVTLTIAKSFKIYV